MSDGTWFRGQSSNHQPAKPGQYQMDYGDGLYLTSEKGVAEIYAAKRVAEKGGTPIITQAVIKPGEIGRVLDLTTDLRWQKFLDTPMVKGNNATRPAVLMRIQQNNYALFKEFLRQNNINIAEYNAVKGPELTHGGVQLAILHQNGVETKLGATIRARLVPISTTSAGGGATQNGTGKVTVVPGTGGPKPGGPGVKISTGGRVVMTVRFIGGSLFMVALSLFAAWLRKKVEDRWLQERMREIEPAISAEIHKRIASIADIQMKGKKAYANVYVDIVTTSEPYGGEYVESFPSVRLKFVDVSDDNTNAEGFASSDSGFGYSKTIRPFLFSTEVAVADETVSAWRDFVEELNWYEKQMAKAPSEALAAQERELRREMAAAFGKDAERVLSAWMWPKFKFKARVTY